MSTSSKFVLKIKDHIHIPERKRNYNEQHFGEAARHYDFATRAMSLGRDSIWKRILVESLPEFKAPVCIDLACGTGDIAFLLAKRYPAGQILGIDLTEAMLKFAKRRNQFYNVSFLQQDMEATGLSDDSADIITGSYAIRNAPELHKTFEEIYRILKPGGFVALLDFSKPPDVWFQRLQSLVLKYWCGFWGLLLHGNPEVHSYIAASLGTFPDRKRLREMILGTGLVVNFSRRFYMGTLELLVLHKPAHLTSERTL